MGWWDKYSFFGAFLGGNIRGTIKGNGVTTTSRIFRVRRGGGSYGAERGTIYQDQYPYFIPSSINNPEGAASRTCFKNAVQAWQALAESVKKTWRQLAHHYTGQTGYSLFIRNYMQENYNP